MQNIFDMEIVAKQAQGADYLEDKVGVGTLSMREFMAGMLSYKPGWMKALMSVRVWLLRFLGQGRHIVPESSRLTAESIPVTSGKKAEFFTVVDSDGETYWFAEGRESHLDAMIGVVVEPLPDATNIKRFHLLTIVRYRNWAGPIYFNIIRPFHHIVVHCAMKKVLGQDGASVK